MKSLVIVIICLLAMVSAAYGQILKDITPGSKDRATGHAREKATIVVDDASITAEVKIKLSDAPSLKNARIDVSTTNGVVTLTGAVRSKQAKGAATKMSRAVKGVKSVDNRLTIESAGKQVTKANVKK